MYNATRYEVVNVRTGEVTPADITTLGDGFVDVLTTTVSGTIGIRFTNSNKDGNLVDEDLSNDFYQIRQVGKQLTPNNDGVITDEGKEIAISQETRKGIDEGTVDPDADIKDVNNNSVNDADEPAPQTETTQPETPASEVAPQA